MQATNIDGDEVGTITKVTDEDKTFYFTAQDVDGNDINTDGSATPKGWYKLDENIYMINEDSMFIHTRHPDNSWTHEEIVYTDDGSYYTKPISVAYLRWFLTPVSMRRGSIPRY
jgi:hypothetical protein